MKADHRDYTGLLRKLRKLPGVKKVFVRSGIRFDYVMADPDPDRTFLRELVEHHVSGQLRVAPEHVSDTVLAAMGKPPRAVYDAFCDAFEEINRETGKKQFVVPYLMSSHPGSTLAEAIELAEYVRDMGFNPEQVQDFYPTPSTISTCMYYTGLDPLTMEPIYVPKTPHEKALQRALIQYRNPANYDLVREALVKAGRTDLIGWDEQCLIRPKRPKKRDADGGAPKGKGRGAKERGSFGKGKNAKGRVSSEREQRCGRCRFETPASRQAPEGQRPQRRHPQGPLEPFLQRRAKGGDGANAHGAAKTVPEQCLQHLGGLLGDVCGAGEALRGERDFDLPFAGAGDAGDEARVREARERSREGGGV